MHTLAAVAVEDPVSTELHLPVDRLTVNDSKQASDTATAPLGDKWDRSHIKVIPRPPEWSVNHDDEEGNSDDSDAEDSTDELTDEVEHDEAIGPNPEANVTRPERGILISFPFLELHSIELLELLSLSITVKCERCKDTMDIKNLRDTGKIGASGVRSESCKKCANSMSIGISGGIHHHFNTYSSLF
jgi:hypothetical protein